MESANADEDERSTAQRLGIAAALLSDPKLLLLDEPSNGLDPAGIVAMRETLRRLAELGKTVFVSSHLHGEVQQMVDVVGIIAASRCPRHRGCPRSVPPEQAFPGPMTRSCRSSSASAGCAR